MSTFARLVYHIYNFLHWYYGVPLSYKVLGESRFIIVVLKKQIVLLLPNSEWSSSLSRTNNTTIWAKDFVYMAVQKLWSLSNLLLFIEDVSNNTFFKFQSYVKFLKKVVI